jgi:flotillin
MLTRWVISIKELKDAPGSDYFSSLSRKAQEGATNQAKIDVADAQRKGNVGEAEQRGRQDRELAKIHAETAIKKNEQEIDRKKAEARLEQEKNNLDQTTNNDKIIRELDFAAKQEESKRDVEIKRAAATLERKRATDVVAATIARESSQQAADAEAYRIEAQAKANRLAEQNTVDANSYNVRVNAEAAKFAAEQMAQAQLCEQAKRAEGIALLADAYAKLAPVLGGPSGVLQYIMIENGSYLELAKANAEGIRGLQPKISVWNTGSNGDTGGDATAAVRNIYQTLPPLMTTINEQTGITLPEWQFGKMNSGENVSKTIVNGH